MVVNKKIHTKIWW